MAAKAVADTINSKFISHAVDLSRFEEDVRQKALLYLRELQDELDRDIAAGLGTAYSQEKLKALKKQVNETISTAYKKAEDTMNKELKGLASVEQSFTRSALNSAIGANLLTTTLTPDQLTSLTKRAKILGAPSVDWWRGQSLGLQEKFMVEMQLGIARGETLNDLQQRIRGKATGQRTGYKTKSGKQRYLVDFKGGIMDKQTRDATALIRTSVQSVANDARFAFLKANDDVIKGQAWLSTLDNRTTPFCQSYDGLSWTLEGEALDGHSEPFTVPPAHWNCFINHNIPIYTSKGWKQIGKIQVGDLVLTHKGRFKKVTELLFRKRQKPAVFTIGLKGIGGSKSAGKLTVTKGHPVLVAGRDGLSDWKPIEDVAVGDKVNIMADRCGCGNLKPYYLKWCSKGCVKKSEELGKVRKSWWDIPGNRDKISNAVKLRLKADFAAGIRDPYSMTSAMHENTRSMVEDGTWPGLFNNLSEEQLKEMSDRMKNNPPTDDPSVRAKISKSAKKFWSDPESAERMSAVHKQYYLDNPEAGKERSDMMKKFWIEHPEKHPNIAMGKRGFCSSLEKRMDELLEQLGLEYTTQHPVNGCFADFAFPDLKIAIEADGTYWHQDKDAELARDEKFKSHGWDIFHFTDKQIYDRPGQVQREISRIVNNHSGNYEFIAVEVSKVECWTPERPKTLYNFSVEEDESYVAKGFVVHNCRSTLVPITKSWAELSQTKSPALLKKIDAAEKKIPAGKRASMGGPVSSRLNYTQWFDLQPESVQLDILGPGKLELYKKGNLSFRDMIDQRGNPLTIKELKERIASSGGLLAEVESSELLSSADLIASLREGVTSRSKGEIREWVQLLDDEQFDKAWMMSDRMMLDMDRILDFKEPKLLGSFEDSIDKWIKAVDPEGRVEAGMLFEDHADLAKYLRADLIKSMQERGMLGEITLPQFAEKEILLYRVGGVRGGYNSFFLNREAAEAYAKRFGVDDVAEYKAKGKNIIPTRSGAGEVFVKAEYTGLPAEIEAEMSARQIAANKNVFLMDRKAWHKANNAEIDLANALGGTHIDGKRPFDLFLDNEFIEHKAVVKIKKGNPLMHQISVEGPAVQRKADFVKKYGVRDHTVVTIRDKNSELFGKMYYKKGIGNFRLSAMEEVRDVDHLKELLYKGSRTKNPPVIKAEIPLKKTLADAEQWGRTNLAPYVDYDNLDANAAQMFNEYASGAFEKLGVKPKRIIFSDDFFDNPNQLGRAFDDGTVAFNPSAFRKADDIKALMKEQYEAGRFTTSSEAHVFRHEAAHLRYFEIGGTEAAAGQELTPKVLEELKQGIDPLNYAKHLSEYAFKNEGEFYAEMLAIEMNGERIHPVAKKIINNIEKKLKAQAAKKVIKKIDPKDQKGLLLEYEGVRKGSKSSRIIEAMHDGSTLEQVAKDAGVSVGHVKNHMKWMETKGFVLELDDNVIRVLGEPGGKVTKKVVKVATKKVEEVVEKVEASKTVGGSPGAKAPTQGTIDKMEKKLQNITDSPIVGGDQMELDPDLLTILEDGTKMPSKGAIKMLGKDGECHWNTAELYKAGEIDNVVIGYTNQGSGRGAGWYQHTWGVKDGKIVETTSSNLGNPHYYGKILSKADSEKFSKWAIEHPSGGVVRRVPPETIKESAEDVRRRIDALTGDELRVFFKGVDDAGLAKIYSDFSGFGKKVPKSKDDLVMLGKLADGAKAAKKATKKATKKVEKAAKKAPEPRDVLLVHPDCSDEFVAALRKSYDEIPDAAKEIFEKSKDSVIHAGPRITDLYPSMKNQHPRGYPEGATWDHCGGFYRSSIKRAVIAEKKYDFWDKSAGLEKIYLGQVDATVKHEIGHALDDLLDDISHKTKFSEAYADDLMMISDYDKRNLGYFIQEGYAGREETFAQLFAEMSNMKTGQKISSSFPKSFRFVKETFGDKAVKELDDAAELARKLKYEKQLAAKTTQLVKEGKVTNEDIRVMREVMFKDADPQKMVKILDDMVVEVKVIEKRISNETVELLDKKLISRPDIDAFKSNKLINDLDAWSKEKEFKKFVEEAKSSREETTKLINEFKESEFGGDLTAWMRSPAFRQSTSKDRKILMEDFAAEKKKLRAELDGKIKLLKNDIDLPTSEIDGIVESDLYKLLSHDARKEHLDEYVRETKAKLEKELSGDIIDAIARGKASSEDINELIESVRYSRPGVSFTDKKKMIANLIKKTEDDKDRIASLGMEMIGRKELSAADLDAFWKHDDFGTWSKARRQAEFDRITGEAKDYRRKAGVLINELKSDSRYSSIDLLDLRASDEFIKGTSKERFALLDKFKRGEWPPVVKTATETTAEVAGKTYASMSSKEKSLVGNFRATVLKDKMPLESSGKYKAWASLSREERTKLIDKWEKTYPLPPGMREKIEAIPVSGAPVEKAAKVIVPKSEVDSLKLGEVPGVELSPFQKESLGWADDIVPKHSLKRNISQLATESEFTADEINGLMELVSKDSRILVRRQGLEGSKATTSILNDGRMKNQFELGRNATSSGSVTAYKDGGRDSWERAISGGNLQKHPGYNSVPGGRHLPTEMAKERPVYGFRYDVANKRSASQYGDVMFELSPSARKRATFTLGNSSGLYSNESVKKGLGTFDNPFNLVRHLVRRSESDSYLRRKLKSALAGSEKVPGMPDGRYVEAQIYGGVDLKRGDVSKIIIQIRDDSDYMKQYWKHMQEIADKYGLDLEYEVTGY